MRYLFVLMLIPSVAFCGSGDTDGNGVFTISDIVYSITYMFGGGPAPVDNKWIVNDSVYVTEEIVEDTSWFKVVLYDYEFYNHSALPAALHKFRLFINNTQADSFIVPSITYSIATGELLSRFPLIKDDIMHAGGTQIYYVVEAGDSIDIRWSDNQSDDWDLLTPNVYPVKAKNGTLKVDLPIGTYYFKAKVLKDGAWSGLSNVVSRLVSEPQTPDIR